MNLILYYGVLAPRAAWSPEIAQRSAREDGRVPGSEEEGPATSRPAGRERARHRVESDFPFELLLELTAQRFPALDDLRWFARKCSLCRGSIAPRRRGIQTALAEPHLA